jgi:hypothetical protein
MCVTDISASPPAPAEHHRVPVGRIVLTVVGALLIFISFGLGAVGGILT